MALIHIYDGDYDQPVKLLCPYCDKVVEPITGERLYPHRTDLWHKRFYRCDPCDAHVGCHAASWAPLGILANAELRRAKSKAHEALDPIWRSGAMSRPDVYAWLASEMGIPLEKCHIGLFDLTECLRVIDLSLSKRGF